MSKVSRSTYQKSIEENKRLLKDIKLLVEGDPCTEGWMECMWKWQKRFQEERDFNALMKYSAQMYVKANPNDPAVIATKEIMEGI